jgi:hypothetical protein
MSNFDKIFIESDIYNNICNYLDIRSIKNLMFSCKEIYSNKINKNFNKKIILKRIYNICYFLFRKYMMYIRVINLKKEDINGNILHVMVLIGSAGKTFGITGAKVIFFF